LHGRAWALLLVADITIAAVVVAFVSCRCCQLLAADSTGQKAEGLESRNTKYGEITLRIEIRPTRKPQQNSQISLDLDETKSRKKQPRILDVS